jgi:uncharacterized protein YneF (UPF0154 family)
MSILWNENEDPRLNFIQNREILDRNKKKKSDKKIKKIIDRKIIKQ